MIKKRFENYKKHLSKEPHMGKVLEKAELQTEEVFEGCAWYVLAPTMNMFIVWTLQQALEKKVKRLYFLARDAYLMFKIANRICTKYNLPIECRYLYCSRFSLRAPLFHFDIEQALDSICADGQVMNLEVILERTGLSEVQKAEVISRLTTGFEPDEDIPSSRLKEVREKLRNCELFMDYFTKHSEKMTPALMGYLKQEGLLDDVPYAVVDCGWAGSVQKSLNQALSHLGVKENVMGFYWGLYELPSKKNEKDYHPFYFSPGKGIKEKVYFSNFLFEAIFSAPHGTTTGYEWVGGKYEPIYLESQQEKIDFIGRIEGKLLQYTDSLLEDVDHISGIDASGAKKTLYHILKLFMSRPSEEEAKYFGGLIFSYDVEEDGTHSIASKFTLQDLKDYQLIPRVLRMLGLKDGRTKVSGWPEGSIVLYGKRIRYHLLQIALYKWLSYTRMQLLWRIKA